MTPIYQQIKHDPDNNQFGDCMKACIASLLDLPYWEVPHFYESGTDEGFDKSLREFLSSQGLGLLDVGYVNWLEDEIPRFLLGQRNIFHLLSGETERGTYHSVVACDGHMIHDPHPTGSGLVSIRHMSFLIRI